MIVPKQEPAVDTGRLSLLGTSDSATEALAECCSTEQSGHDLAVGMSASGCWNRTKAATRSAPPTRPELVQGDHIGAELRESLTPVGRVSEGIHKRGSSPEAVGGSRRCYRPRDLLASRAGEAQHSHAPTPPRRQQTTPSQRRLDTATGSSLQGRSCSSASARRRRDPELAADRAGGTERDLPVPRHRGAQIGRRIAPNHVT